jgi:hypothetical protein
MSDRPKHLNRQIASLESSIAEKIASLKAAQDVETTWKAATHFIQGNTRRSGSMR